MEQKYLIINIGSQSKKYALFGADGRILISACLEDEAYREPLPAHCFAGPVAVAVRIVAPGQYFLRHRPIDAAYEAALAGAASLAPLHVRPTLNEIGQIRQQYPDVPLYGISDSAYYAERPAASRLYGLSPADAAQWDLYRFGYHGLSVASSVDKLARVGLASGRVVVCHVGGGVSVVGLRDGRVVETSMGFTPLEGPIMGTRVGRIDAGAVLALLQARGGTLGELEVYFNEACGLAALGGHAGHVRQLLAAEGEDPAARVALEVFVWTIKKEIGAVVALLGGVDVVVLTATIAERSATMRARLIIGLEGLGLALDEAKNQAVPAEPGSGLHALHLPDSRAKIFVTASDENGPMLSLVRELHQV